MRLPQSSHDPAASLADAPKLALLLDLDGTLIPFAATAADAVLDEEGAALLRDLVAADIRLTIVSGRPQSLVEPLRARVPGAAWFAEHGVWRCDADGWQRDLEPSAGLRELVAALEDVAARFSGAYVERKSAGVALHWRAVPEIDRGSIQQAAEHAIAVWMARHADHERLPGASMIEVRRAGRDKSAAVRWVRERHGEVPIIAIGDDVTDEDMFRALGDDDLPIRVGRASRATAARALVDDVAGVRRFLRWLGEARGAHGPVAPAPLRGDARPTDLLVISNRMPTLARGRQRAVGGLVAALEPAIRDRGAVWLGWSGEEREHAAALTVDRTTRPARACFDLSQRARRKFYAGFCNRVMWPLLHGFPSRLRYDDDEWEAYVEANAIYADLAARVASPDATIWVHDYHLFLVGAALRERGHRGRIGLFVHVPFPGLEVVETLPWAQPLLDAMASFDLVGFHTARWGANFTDALRSVCDATVDGDVVQHRDRACRVGVFPIGIEPERFAPVPGRPQSPDVAGLIGMLGGRKLLLGVDRLDYSKGIPQRLQAFERLLERRPHWRRRVHFVQVSVPSRADVPDYAELRDRVEHLVGRINGKFGEADWVPVRYLYRAYDPDVLAELYRAADVAVVTPLRDGMNLVAKEFVAAQTPDAPGVLVLSKFAGAADELRDAVLTNPYHRDGLADDLDHALSMPIEERRERHRRLLSEVNERTATRWAASFLGALERTRGGGEPS